MAYPRPGLSRRTALPTGIVLTAALLLVWLVATRPMPAGDPQTVAALDAILLWDGILPRAAVALLAGGVLALSGVLLQAVLRNPIADASTLGVASGAQLGMALAAGAVPLIGMPGAEAAAFAGGCATLGLVLVLCWRGGLDPVSVALSGMIVSLVAAALSVTVILAQGDYALSIHIWGAGTLSQTGWSSVTALAPRLAIGLAAAFLISRPLTVLSLGDAGARSLGVSLLALRLAALALAVWLAATVTALCGIIGFLGLAAPALARFCGARTSWQMLAVAPLAGGLLLLIADTASQILGPGFADLAPAGAATALLGGPVLLALIPRVRSAHAPATMEAETERSRFMPGLPVLACIAVTLLAVTVLVGPDAHGVGVISPETFHALMPLRLPRVIAASGAGALLGAAGVIMQRLTGNPIAGPEVLGVASGGGAGLAVALIAFGFLTPLQSIAAMMLGAIGALAVILAIAGRSGLSPERMLLSGIAIGAFCMAVVSLVLAQGDIRAFALLTWMSGSTNRAGLFEALLVLAALAVLAPPVLVMNRWLSLLPLGNEVSMGLGLPVRRARLALAGLAAAMTAIASFLVGPLTLSGLVAPHVARLLGFVRPGAQLVAAMLTGALALGLADWLSRIVIFPYQTPIGLFAALLGGSYLLWLLGRKESQP